MRAKKIKIVGFMLCVLIVLTSVTPCLAMDFYEKKKIGAHWMAYDALIIRPLSVAEVALGSVLWALSFPTIGRTQSGDVFSEQYIDNPFTFAFERPTGDFSK